MKPSTKDKIIRFCKRCKNELRNNSWVSLDNKRFYHPHCFTCGECGVMLESMKNKGPAKATRDDVVCYFCYCRNHKAPLTDCKRNQRLSTTYMVSREIPESSSSGSTQSTNSTRPRWKRDKQVDPKFSNSSNEYTGHGAFTGNSEPVKLRKTKATTTSKSVGNMNGNGYPTEGVSGVKKGKTKKLVSTMCGTDTVQEPSSARPCKRSRIPRPTSANETTKTTSTPLTLSKSAKPVKTPQKKTSPVQMPPLASKPRQESIPQKSKMHRSMSMIQTRKEDSKDFETANKATTCRPKSAGSCTREYDKVSEKVSQQKPSCPNAATQTRQDTSDTSPKRTCAASFSPKRKKRIDDLQSNALPYPPIELPPYPCPSEKESLSVTQSSISSNDTSNYSTRGIPSTKAILDAIKRGGSSLIQLKARAPPVDSSSYEVLHTDKAAERIAPSKCSFNVTFECPICVRSLLPVNDNSSSSGEPEGVVERQRIYSNTVTSCGHLFHTKCMEHWLLVQGNTICPICSATCLLESLRPVHLECNLCADLNRKTVLQQDSEITGLKDAHADSTTIAAFRTLKTEFEMLKAKYNALLAENHNYTLSSNVAANLKSAYDMECRSRLQLQWENRKLLMKLEEATKSNETKHLDEIYSQGQDFLED